MDVIKDRLYSEAPDSLRRRAAQTVLANILEVLVRILSPILSFTCDEVWEFYPPKMRIQEGRPVSVQLAGWPSRDDFAPSLPEDGGLAAMEKFSIALTLREAAMKAIEEARGAGSVKKSQEVAVRLQVPSDMMESISALDSAIYEELFIVSGVTFEEGPELSATVEPAKGQKCPRCWNYRELGEDSSHPDVCARCASVLNAIGFEEE